MHSGKLSTARLSPEEARRLQEIRGHETEESLNPGKIPKAAPPRPGEPKPVHFLPPAGRHTDVLEREMNPYEREAMREGGTFEKTDKSSGRRPSGSDAPELKKPKLEVDCEMHAVQDVSPGEAIFGSTQADSQDDVEIPDLEQANSPSFASQAKDIPCRAFFPIPGEVKAVPHIDLTEQDRHIPLQGDDDDELRNAARPSSEDGSGTATGAGHGKGGESEVATNLGANLLNSHQVHANSVLNSTACLNSHANPQPNNS